MSTAVAIAASSMDTAPRRGLRILFLAARPATASVLQQTLGHETGAEFHLTIDPQETEAMARSESPDLILLDLPWAARAGRQLVERLRAANVDARIAVLGDLYGTRAREAARQIGADGFTPDPASRDLLKVMRALVSTPRRKSTSTAKHSLELAVA